MDTVNEIHEAYLSGKAVGRCQGARGDTSALDTKVEILTASNKESTQCQHVFYSIKFAGKVRCNKCEAEFPVISTC